MLNSITTKLVFAGGVGLIATTILGHSLFDWGGRSNQGNTNTLRASYEITRTGGEDPQHSKLPQEQIKETKNCYSVLSIDSKDHLLACLDKGSNQSLAFYYYNSHQRPFLLEKIVSLKTQIELGRKLTINLKKDTSGPEINLTGVSYSSNTPWFWSGWFREELQLGSLCQRFNILSEHYSRRQNLTCEWKIKEKDGKEVWQLFQS